MSKKEQCKRFLYRIEHKEKHWKFSSADIEERKFWNAYQDAYEEAIQQTSTKNAPWYVIPADNKLQAHLLMGKIILEKLKEMRPAFPSIDKKEKELVEQAQKELEKEINRYC